jgi:putative ABC transport system permease protein
MLTNFFKIALRTIARNKVYSFINVIGLTLGISCCMVILIFVRYESTFDNGYPLASKTFRVVQHTKYPEQTLYWGTTAYPLAAALRNDFDDFSTVTQTAGPMSRTFSVEANGTVNRFEENLVLFVDSLYTTVFETEWLAGNPKSALTHVNSVVLTRSVAEKYFGNSITDFAGLLGRTILLNGKDPLTVTGVVKDPEGNVNLNYNLLVPYEFFRGNNQYQSSNWSGNYRGTTFVVLNDVNAKSSIEQKIATWKKKYQKPEDDARISYFLQPLRNIHNETTYGAVPGGYTMSSGILNSALAVAAFILIIAAVNFINLTTAQSAIRSREVGVRKVMGSSRLALIRQFVGEHAILISFALCLSLAVTQVSLDLLNDALNIINLKLVFLKSDFLIVCITGLVIIVLAAIYPAIVLSGYKPIDAIRTRIQVSATRRFSLRKSLIVLQFAVVQIFIIATIVVATQINYFRSTDLGFKPGSVTIVSAPEIPKLDAFRNSLLQLPGVEGVSYGSGPPVSIGDFALGTTFRLPSQPVEEGMEAEMKILDTTYLQFYGLELLAGRNISANKDWFEEFIVNEKVIQAMGWSPEEALGKRLMINEGEATIVGVVKDFHNTSLQEEISPCVFMNWKEFQWSTFIRTTKPNDPETLAAIEKRWKSFSPEGVYKYSFLSDEMTANYKTENMVYSGFTLFSFLAITIGCLGLIGLMSFMTIRRAKEVGIRKVLGASIAQIVNLFSKEFLLLIGIAFIVAAPVAYITMQSWLNDFVYRIDLQWWMFAGGGAIALLIAGTTVSVQSIKAASANPVESLKDE